MLKHMLATALLAGTIALAGATNATRADALLSQGIGSSNCARLLVDIKPSEGLNDPINLMLYAWVQGYISAANVALLEYDGKYVDMSVLTDAHVLDMIQDFCRANPDKKPANALDNYLKTTKKMKSQWTAGTVAWDE
jgi:hypothetical protein